MKHVKTGCVLLCVGITLATVCTGWLWNALNNLYICTLILGIICSILGVAQFFLSALQLAAEERNRRPPDAGHGCL
jgi:hypothetical protein